jgi:hypothetical protein
MSTSQEERYGIEVVGGVSRQHLPLDSAPAPQSLVMTPAACKPRG